MTEIIPVEFIDAGYTGRGCPNRLVVKEPDTISRQYCSIKLPDAELLEIGDAVIETRETSWFGSLPVKFDASSALDDPRD